jgi:hypothetical protein
MSAKRQVRIYLEPHDEAAFDSLSGGILTDTQIASVLVRGALEAVRINGGTLRLPVRFRVDETETEARAPVPKRKAS